MASCLHRFVTVFLGLGILVASLSGCSKNVITMDRLADIHRGMSPDQVAAALEDRVPKTVLTLQESAASVAVYDMVTGSTTVTTTTYVAGVNGGPGTVQTRTMPVETTEPYFLLYRDEALLYWGFLDEYGRDEDPEVRELRDQIAETYQEYVDEQARRRRRGQGAL